MMDIDKMEGRELDAKIAKLMGWKFLPLPKGNRYGLCRNCGRTLWNDHMERQDERGICVDDECFFSEEIAAAWLVVEKIAEDHEVYIGAPFNELEWECTVDDGGHLQIEVTADTAPLAICRAALMATETE